MDPYSDIVAGRGNSKKFKVLIRAKGNQTSETTKELIKTNARNVVIEVNSHKKGNNEKQDENRMGDMQSRWLLTRKQMFQM